MKIFISYSRDDLEWADKLKASLPRHQVFFDRDSLRAGDSWETQILGSLTDADHLIVLWSKNAKESHWVQREVGHFDSKRFKGGRRVPGHLLLHILLDGTGSAYASDQAITDLRDSGAYDHPVAEVPAQAWSRVMDQVEGALQDPALPVSLALLTLTKRYVTCADVPKEQRSSRCIDFEFIPPGGKSLQDLMAAMKLTLPELAEFYGEGREEWRPFGGRQSIGDILSELKRQLNGSPKAVPIRWVPVDDELLSNETNRISNAANQLANGLSLVVFDPIALYSQWMRNLIHQYLEGCLNNPHAIVAVLPIFPMPDEPRMTHTRMLRQVYSRLVDQFYEELPLVEHAQCSIFTADDADIRRMVRGTLRDFFVDPREGSASAYLGLKRS